MKKLIIFIILLSLPYDVIASDIYSRCKMVREAVVRPVMEYMGIENPVLEDLMAGISSVESMSGKYLRQIGSGYARGLMQIELPTYEWLIDTGRVPGKILALGKSYKEVENNHFYGMGIAISLILWRMENYPLPDKNYTTHDEYMEYLTELAEYWKRFYNTHLGDGTVTKFKSRWFENGCYLESEDWE